jgi:tRNA(fMet)-specific endonuclease VapC
MTLYLLDTDHLSLYQRGNAAVLNHLTGKVPAQVFISMITAEEIMRGRLAQIRAAKNEVEHIKACYWLGEGLELLKEFAILPYDPLASQHYQTLRQQKLRVGSQDLRIAAVALAAQATLVTANRIHFAQVSGLSLEDWTT